MDWYLVPATFAVMFVIGALPGAASVNVTITRGKRAIGKVVSVLAFLRTRREIT